MTTLYCDICGASFPDTEEQCPICGSARALTDETPYSGHTHSAVKKIRGGRYSKKNVDKRMKDLELGIPEPEPEEGEELQEPVPAERFLPTREVQEQRKARRRTGWLNFLLVFAWVLFLASVAFVVGHYALPYAQSMGWLPEALADYIPRTAGSPFPWP